MTDTDPSFRVARIVYFTDLTRRDARVIPLGVLAEVLLPNVVHGLALKARGELLPAEIALLNPLVREGLATPFAFLRPEFQLAWENAPAGMAIEFLANKHTSSLSVLAPTDYSEGNWLTRRLLPPRHDAVEGKLSAALDAEFDKVSKQYSRPVDSEPVAPAPKLIESAPAKAA